MKARLADCDFEPKREVSEKEYGVNGANVDIEIHTTPDIEEIEDNAE